MIIVFLFGWIIFWWTAVDDDHASVVDAERDASSNAASTTVLEMDFIVVVYVVGCLLPTYADLCILWYNATCGGLRGLVVAFGSFCALGK